MFIYPSSKNPVFQEFGLSAISGKKNSWVLNSRKHLFMFLFTFFKKIEILKPCPIWFWKKLVYGFSCRKIFFIPTLNSTGDDNCSCIGQRIGKLIFLLQILEENMEAFFASHKLGGSSPNSLTIFLDFCPSAPTLPSDLKAPQFSNCLEHRGSDAPSPFPPRFLLPSPHWAGIIEHIWHSS